MPPVIRKEKTKENLNIVDLDELFNQKVKSQEEENIALEEFLSGFSYMDSSNQSTDQTTTPEPALDEELYNNVIEDNELKFNKDDIERINKILQSEIGDSTLKNIEKYAVSNPLKPTKKQILEELVTTYTISQNIRFSKEDVDTLYKLINVEIDPDFVKDLSVNRSRTQEMAKQIESYTSERKKPSEIMTLKVADLLPNLADVMANPEKYKDQEPVRAEVDESTLLKNIQNVTFKPFYDGSEKFEVINTFDEEREENILEINKSETQNIVNRSSDISADSKYVGGRQIPPKKLSSENLQCILDGRSYSVLSSVEFIDKNGCHLAKNDSGYFVLGYSGDEVKIIKNMGSARCERIIARMSEAIDGGGRYIIRAGAQKFLVEVKNNCVEFVMDL